MNSVPRARLLFALIVGSLVFAPVTRPARAEPSGCDLLADMAIVARALAQEAVPQDLSARIMARIYSAPASLIAGMAASAAQDTRTPTEVAQAVLQACHRGHGMRNGKPLRRTL